MKKVLLIITSLFITYFSSAQIRAVTENGDTINVYENGTWEKIEKETKISTIETTVEATTEVDEFEKTKKIRTDTWRSFGTNKMNNKISGNLFRVDKLTVFTISYGGDLGCLSEYSSTMKVKLTNGDVIEFSQISDTDCGDYPSARFVPLTREELKNPDYQQLLDENIELLKQFDWVTIRLQGSEYYTDLTPNSTSKVPKPEQFFRQHILAADKE
jgi:hypothetical protein